MRLRLDDDHAIFGHALILQVEQPFFQYFRQRRRVYIKTQMNRARYLVYMLPARALCTDGGQVDFTGKE